MPSSPAPRVPLPQRIIYTLLAFALVFAAAAIGATLVVLLAFAVGKVLVHLLPFSTFEATLLSLLALVVFTTAMARAIESFLTLRAPVEAPEEPPDDEPDAVSTPRQTIVFTVPSAPSSPIEADARRIRRPSRKR